MSPTSLSSHDPRQRRSLRHSGEPDRLRNGPRRQPAATACGFSIGIPTMLPHSVHEPS